MRQLDAFNKLVVEQYRKDLALKPTGPAVLIVTAHLAPKDLEPVVIEAGCEIADTWVMCIDWQPDDIDELINWGLTSGRDVVLHFHIMAGIPILEKTLNGYRALAQRHHGNAKVKLNPPDVVEDFMLKDET